MMPCTRCASCTCTGQVGHYIYSGCISTASVLDGGRVRGGGGTLSGINHRLHERRGAHLSGLALVALLRGDAAAAAIERAANERAAQEAIQAHPGVGAAVPCVPTKCMHASGRHTLLGTHAQQTSHSLVHRHAHSLMHAHICWYTQHGGAHVVIDGVGGPRWRARHAHWQHAHWQHAHWQHAPRQPPQRRHLAGVRRVRGRGGAQRLWRTSMTPESVHRGAATPVP